MRHDRNIFIGHDARELTAYRVACQSITDNAKRCRPLINPISSRTLGPAYYRPTSRRDGVLWDNLSDAPMATEFSLARFFVPILQRKGWAMFCDADFMFRADVDELFELADDRYAVMCMKHDQQPTEKVKMDGQVQTTYARKNWSSLFLVNCDAPEVQAFSIIDANAMKGAELHQFAWIRDDDRIGALPIEWNWLAGVNDPILYPKAVHYTLGTPDMNGYEDYPFADEWRAYAFG
jgi:hypothetical protein